MEAPHLGTVIPEGVVMIILNAMVGMSMTTYDYICCQRERGHRQCPVQQSVTVRRGAASLVTE